MKLEEAIVYLLATSVHEAGLQLLFFGRIRILAL